MSHDLQELEARLRALRPAELDAAYVGWLASVTRGQPAPLDTAAAAVESALCELEPLPLPADLMSAILRQTTGRQAAVVAFPGAPPARRRTWNRYMLPLAAAVALLGAAAALLVPTKPLAPGVADGRPAPETPVRIPSSLPVTPQPGSAFMPAGFRTDLSRASDEGVLWGAQNQPHRVVKVLYRDRVILIDPDGRKITVERPREEYILMPEKLD